MDLSKILRAACTARLYLGTIPSMVLLAAVTFTLAIIISLKLSLGTIGSDKLTNNQAKINKDKLTH